MNVPTNSVHMVTITITMHRIYNDHSKCNVGDGYFAHTRSNNMASNMASNETSTVTCISPQVYSKSRTRVVFVETPKCHSHAYAIATHPHSGQHILVGYEIIPFGYTSTCVICIGTVAVELLEYELALPPSLVVYRNDGDEPPSEAALKKIEIVALEMRFESLHNPPLFVEVIHSVATSPIVATETLKRKWSFVDGLD